jgi:SulP family sulfate permease
MHGTVSDKALLLLTLVLTVLVDLTVAIGVGVAAGLIIRFLNNKTTTNDWTPPER